MKQFKPISQLFNALKSQYFAREDRVFQTHNFREKKKIIFVTSSLRTLFCPAKQRNFTLPGTEIYFLEKKLKCFIVSAQQHDRLSNL